MQARRRFYIGPLDILPAFIAPAFSCAEPVSPIQLSSMIS
jgi:hypothetical protein